MKKWLIVGVIALVGVVLGVRYLMQRRARDIEAMRFPIPTTPAQRAVLETEAAKWRAGKSALLATIAAFEASEPATSDRPCPLSLALPRVETPTDGERLASARDRDPDENIVLAFEGSPLIADKVSSQMENLLATADRGRFHSVRGRQLAIAAISLPLVVMKLEEKQSPALTTNDSMYGSFKAFVPGRRAGIAYVFDKQTGKLRCAGRFEATSSESIKTVQGDWGAGDEKDALEIDFEVNTIKAIEAAVRAVE